MEHSAASLALRRLNPTNAWLPPLLLGLTFLVFMFYGFGGAFPPGLNHDAAWHGLTAFRILNGERLGVYIPESYGHETPYYYVMAGMFSLLGASKETIEITATLFGGLAVALFYGVMLKRTRNPWLALGCSLLWLSSSALVLYSRVGWQLVALIPASLWVAASCRFYLDDAERHRMWAAALGLAAGFTLYTYNGGRTILLFLPVFWLFRLVQVRLQSKKVVDGPSVGSTALDGALSMGVFLLVAAPMLWYAANNWQAWNGRATSLLSGSGGLASKWANLVTSLGYFNVSAHGDDFFTNFAVLEGPMLGLWVAGILFGLARFRSYWPELLLFATFLLPSIVTQPSFHRAVGTLPLIYLLACSFLLAFGRRVQTRLGARWNQFGSAAFALLVAFQLGAGWKKLYLDKQPFAWGFYPETTVVGRYLHAHPQENFVVYARNWPKDALAFLSTTDSARPGANFVNYQGYNTISRDGLSEISLDLGNGTIARPAQFVVDPSKADAFLSLLSQRYTVREIGQLPLDGPTVARLFRVE